ncbi:hypothetical protein [Bacillus sp. ISL-37]|uniref:hypothetical protein n=1 Tax=Bacillus sp. ISL-37 TaxID=2819123 RepID=UPI001BECA99F|nr:hypothetical protein [Bacillus sp. ISL-37]
MAMLIVYVFQIFKIARNTYINYSKKKQNKMEFQTDFIDVHWSQQPDQYKRSDDQHQIELTLLGAYGSRHFYYQSILKINTR